MVAISSVHALFQGRNILISCAISIDSFRGAAQQQIDCRGNQFNVAVFLGRNVGDEIEVRLQLLASTEVEGLERVVHQGGHFAEFDFKKFLDAGSGISIG